MSPLLGLLNNSRGWRTQPPPRLDSLYVVPVPASPSKVEPYRLPPRSIVRPEDGSEPSSPPAKLWMTENVWAFAGWLPTRLTKKTSATAADRTGEIIADPPPKLASEHWMTPGALRLRLQQYPMFSPLRVLLTMLVRAARLKTGAAVCVTPIVHCRTCLRQ